MIGEIVKGFKITARLGKGGMGEVFAAEQQIIGTKVAIKLLLADVSSDTQQVQRFFNEGLAVSKIKHAGIVKIFDVGFHEARAFLIMELLEGESLAARIARTHRLTLAQVADAGKQIASVLAATHAAGVTHRDLKPDNIFLVADSELASGERVKVLDFGIAKTTLSAITGTGNSMGTPAYMAPEQWNDASKADGRADIYSLGCVVFEACCGRPPFVASSIGEACTKHLTEVPVRASTRAEVPPELDDLIARMLAKAPDDRPTLKEIGDVLGTMSTVEPTGLDATLLPGESPARSLGFAASRAPITTLGSAAGSVVVTALTTPPRRKPGLIAAGVVVAVAAVGAGVYALASRTAPASPPATPPTLVAAVAPVVETAHAPLVTLELHDGARFSAHYRNEFLRWSPAPKAGSDVVEIERLDASGSRAAVQPLAKLTVPEGADYLGMPWDALERSPGRYRVRVVRAGSPSPWVGFSYFASALDRLRAEHELRVGVEKVQHKPFVYWDPVAGEYRGFDVELLRKIATTIDPAATVKPVPSDWEALVPPVGFPETESPPFDVVASAVSVTADRCQRFSFSHPYLRTGQRLIRACGKKPAGASVVGVQRNTTSEAQGTALAKSSRNITVRPYDSNDRVFDALKRRQVDAILVDDLLGAAGAEMQSKPPEWCFDGPRLSDEDYGILMPTREVELAAEIDRAVDTLTTSGALATLARAHGLPDAALAVGSGCPKPPLR